MVRIRQVRISLDTYSTTTIFKHRKYTIEYSQRRASGQRFTSLCMYICPDPREKREEINISREGQQLVRKTSKGDDIHMSTSGHNETFKRDKGTSPTLNRDNSINALYGEGEMRFSEDRRNTLNWDKDAHITPVRDHQISVRAPWYGASTTLTLKGVVQNMLRHTRQIKAKGSIVQKIKKQNFPNSNSPGILNYGRNKTKRIFCAHNNRPRKHIMHPVTGLLDTGAGPKLISKYFMPEYKMFQMKKSTAKALYSASKDPL